MEFKTYLPRNKITMQKGVVLNTEEIYNWETWHRRFGHVSYSGLQKLFNKNMVEGFTSLKFIFRNRFYSMDVLRDF